MKNIFKKAKDAGYIISVIAAAAITSLLHSGIWPSGRGSVTWDAG